MITAVSGVALATVPTTRTIWPGMERRCAPPTRIAMVFCRSDMAGVGWDGGKLEMERANGWAETRRANGTDGRAGGGGGGEGKGVEVVAAEG